MPKYVAVKSTSAPTVNKTVYKEFRGVDFHEVNLQTNILLSLFKKKNTTRENLLSIAY